MKKITGVVLLALLALTTGCVTAPQLPVALEDSFWQQEEKKVGIAMTEIPKLTVHLPGASCLLCIATAKLANSALSKHVETLSYGDLPELKTELAKRFEKRGTAVSVLDEVLNLKALPKNKSKLPNSAYKDFSAFKEKYGISHLLVVDIRLIGMHRTYSSYIPTSDPKAVFDGSSYLVDLENNTYDWYLPFDIYKSSSDEWDEPPSFPGLTNAYYQALEIGKESIYSPFSE